MLLSVLLLTGLALILTAVLAMSRAERRARRNLFLALGVGGEALELLMSRNGDVLTELTLVRMSGVMPLGQDDEEPSGGVVESSNPPFPRQPTIHLVHPIVGETRSPRESRRKTDAERKCGP